MNEAPPLLVQRVLSFRKIGCKEIHDGTLDDCIQEFTANPESTRHLQQIWSGGWGAPGPFGGRRWKDQDRSRPVRSGSERYRLCDAPTPGQLVFLKLGGACEDPRALIEECPISVCILFELYPFPIHREACAYRVAVDDLGVQLCLPTHKTLGGVAHLAHQPQKCSAVGCMFKIRQT